MSDSKRIFLALALSIGVIGIQQMFFTPDTPATIDGPIEPVARELNGETTPTNNGPIEPNSPVQRVEAISGQTYTITSRDSKYTIDSSLKLIEVVTDKAKFAYQDIIGGEVKPRVQFKVSGEAAFRALNFQATSETSNELILESAEGVLATYTTDDNGLLQLNLRAPSPFELRFFINSEEQGLDSRDGRGFAVVKKDYEKTTVGDDEKSVGSIKWFGVDFNYHLFAVVFPEKMALNYSIKENGIFMASTKGLFDGQQDFSKDLKYAFALKEYDTLSGLGDNLVASVDFGIWSILSIPMLKALKFFYGLLGNWGWAIILLTLCMRLMTFPLQYKSFKSMKRMQMIQPQLKKINEKYADNPTQKQKETMAIFKKEGVNPLGGCLPMLLQFPIFIAFYRMLGAAVELVGAPFYFWIQDLSQKDPYYILPVLVTVVFFLQQKLTPSTTADPTQKKIMMFMPLIFGFIMKDLPSGLNLYIFASTLLGISMQKLTYKMMDNSPALKTKNA